MTDTANQSTAQADAERTAMGRLRDKDPVTPALITSAIDAAVASVEAMPTWYDDPTVDREQVRRYIEDRVNVWTAEQSSLSDDRDHVPWLEDQRGAIEWSFWERYQEFISEDLPPAAVKQVNRITDDVLSRLESPRRTGAWDRRGMVVGQVQSGKTANYTGLICKAADAGYRLIVVLAGMHDSLRSQTQERIDEGLLGWDTQFAMTHKDGARSHRTGVGAMVKGSKLLPVGTFTSSAAKGDFNRKVAQQVAPQIGSDPVVLVVKKHKTILENLIEWTTREAVEDPETGRSQVLNHPILVIDDEADNASVNTKDIERETDEEGNLVKETDPTAINRLIRKLLFSFQQSAYVGYTATPFANIFIFEDEDHQSYGEDLFPRSFITRIPPPSNYVGAARVFGLPAAESPDGVEIPPLPIVKEVDDSDGFIENPKRKDSLVGALPPSLKEAVQAFVLACAGRAARGDARKHNSMLVHVTRFVLVQEQVAERLQDEIEAIQLKLRHGEGSAQKSIRAELRDLWERDFEPTTAAIPEHERGRELAWTDVEAHLLDAASKIIVRKVNGQAADSLTYKDHRDSGLNVIAVGGDKLSRGLTLEGLSVSYYLRTSKMYDTLLQMGRWFGYRERYLDLCRLYTTAELRDWYRDITIANEELNREFAAMAAADLTPRDYGLRVRTHPEGLLVTARAKMRHARDMRLSYAGVCAQVTAFDIDPGAQEMNAERVDRFLRQNTVMGRLSEERGDRGAHIWNDVPGEEIAGFVERFRISAGALRVNGPQLAQYMAACIAQNELKHWTVAVPSRLEREAEDNPLGVEVGGVRVGMLEREARTLRDRTFSVRAILNPADELLDLSPDQREAAKKDTKRRFDAGTLITKDGKPPKRADGISARAVRGPRRGLLLLYAIEPTGGDAKDYGALDPTKPLFGLAVSFPATKGERTISYRVNNVYWQMELGVE